MNQHLRRAIINHSFCPTRYRFSIRNNGGLSAETFIWRHFRSVDCGEIFKKRPETDTQLWANFAGPPLEKVRRSLYQRNWLNFAFAVRKSYDIRYRDVDPILKLALVSSFGFSSYLFASFVKCSIGHVVWWALLL